MNKQLKLIPLWAKSISQFNELDLDDQVSLLRASKVYSLIFLIKTNLVKPDMC